MPERTEGVRARAAWLLPFAIAIVLPPAGFVMGLITLEQDRNLGTWQMIVAVAAAGIWALVLLSV
jgi:hypothetical protein